MRKSLFFDPSGVGKSTASARSLSQVPCFGVLDGNCIFLQTLLHTFSIIWFLAVVPAPKLVFQNNLILTHQTWESRLHLQEACHKSPASASWMATASFCKHFFTLFRLYGFLLSSLHQNQFVKTSFYSKKSICNNFEFVVEIMNACQGIKVR